jgi:hypothetical protein
MDRRSFVAGTLGVLASAAVPAGALATGDPALALLGGSRWPGKVVTYGFPEAGFAWEYRTGFTAGFLPANATEIALYRRALGEWAAASGGAVSCVETTPGRAHSYAAIGSARPRGPTADR